MTPETAAALLARWGLEGARPRPDLELPGSPERCVWRGTFETSGMGGGRLWMLERLAPNQADRRQAIGTLLARLTGAGLKSAPAPLPLRPKDGGGFVLTADGSDWQLSPFVPGVALDRPDYALRAAPGAALGGFLADLADLAEISGAIDIPPGLMVLDQPRYVQRLLADMNRRDPGALDRAHRAARALAPYWEALPELPQALAHGDVHPLNVIWDEGDRIAAVIDWEFAGLRHELYDAANALGCLGFEAPESLRDGAGAALVRELKARGPLHRENVRWLRPAIAASRFGWLSEWLRRRDHEMVALELEYLETLVS